jgi:ubiquinone/menaquinone biosynthesis C-methylase UbiE
MFDRWAPGYDNSALQPTFSRAHRAVLDSVNRLGIPPRRILDLGCGTGRLLAEAARTFPEADLLGVDPSAGMLSIAAGRTPTRCRLVQAGAEHLPFPDAAFDLVTATYSLRHWHSPEVALHQIARVLTPQGLFVFVDVFPEHRRRARAWPYRFGIDGPLPAVLAQTLRSARLRPTEVTTISGCGAVTDMTVAIAVNGSTRAHRA